MYRYETRTHARQIGFYKHMCTYMCIYTYTDKYIQIYKYVTRMRARQMVIDVRMANTPSIRV